MAQKQTYFVCRDGTQFGEAETVELTPGQAAAFVRAGDLAEIEGSADRKRLKRARSAARAPAKTAVKDDAALKGEIKALAAELAGTKAELDQVKVAREEAAFEAESLKRVVERLREVGPEAVQQAEQAVAAELEAQAAEADSAAAAGGGQ